MVFNAIVDILLLLASVLFIALQQWVCKERTKAFSFLYFTLLYEVLTRTLHVILKFAVAYLHVCLIYCNISFESYESQWILNLVPLHIYLNSYLFIRLHVCTYMLLTRSSMCSWLRIFMITDSNIYIHVTQNILLHMQLGEIKF